MIDPVGGELSEPALRTLRWGGRFVTVGYAAGVIPRIPLNLVLLKDIHILGFQFRDFASHQPEDMVRNDRELLELLAEEPGPRPLIGARVRPGRGGRDCSACASWPTGRRWARCSCR